MIRSRSALTKLLLGEDSLNLPLLAKQLELILDNRTHGLPTVALALMLTVYLGFPSDAVTWLLMVVLSKLLALRTGRAWIAGGLEGREYAVFRMLLLHLFIDGLLWGGIVASNMTAGGSNTDTLLLCIAVGVASTASATVTALMPCFFAFAIPQLLLPAGRLLFLPGDLAQALFGACLIYFAVQAQQAIVGWRTIRTALLASEQNRQLLVKLAAASKKERTARRRAEESSHERARFLASASHDLRQPIHAQALFFRPLLAGPLTPSQLKAAKFIQQANESASAMLHSILDFFRVESGSLQVITKPFAVQELLRKLEAEFGPLADEHGLVYRYRDSMLSVHSDPVVVELILRNLISNAIRYTQTGGVLVATRRRGSRLSFEVWDTGVGIAPQHQEQVFSEFFQVSQSVRKGRVGMGLGLTIAQKLCRNIGSTLEVRSRLGRGSVFRFALPIHEELRPSASPASSASRDFRALANVNVLYVDDDPNVCVAMSEMLQTVGCRVSVASDLESAMSIASRDEPALILTDFQLGGDWNGIEILQVLRDAYPGALAAIITGDTSSIPPRLAKAAGIPLYHKPMSSEQLLWEMCELLRREHAIPEEATTPA